MERSIYVVCPQCQESADVPAEFAGKTGRCKRCGTAVRVPSPGTPAGSGNNSIEKPGDEVPQVWHAGDVILGLYEVLDVFAGGGMGLVYRVHHRGWNIELAVKSPRPEYFVTDRHKEAFVREAETWVGLRLHPHIVGCFYVRTLGGTPRVFAEYVDGGSLQEWIESGRLYEGGQDQGLERILDIAIQTAWGLSYAHEQGLVHQDIKPGNVMMAGDGVAKVTDFGLAKLHILPDDPGLSPSEQSLEARSVARTPAFNSPEQASSQTLSPKTDIWSWGVSTLEMFTGEITWADGVVAAEALEDYLQDMTEHRAPPSMPPAVADLLRHCFRQDPSSRPTMTEIADTLCEIYLEENGSPYSRPIPRPAESLADDLNNRALSLKDLGRTTQAEELFTAALEADPRHAEATYNRGLLRWRAAQITDVSFLVSLEEVCRSHAEEWNPFYLLALAQLERGDTQNAGQALDKAVQAAPDNTPAQSTLQAVRQRLNEGRHCVRTFSPPSGDLHTANALCLSGDERLVLTGGDFTLKLWEIESGRCIQTFEGHPTRRTADGVVLGNVTSVCLSRDGRVALSASWDETIKAWEVATGKCLRTLTGHLDWVNAVCLSRDSRIAFSGGGGKPVLSSSNQNTLKMWDVASGSCLRTFEGHGGRVNSLNLSPDEKYLLSGSGDNTLKLWEVSTGRCLRTLEGHEGGVTCACLSCDGQMALSGSDDNTLKLWDVFTGRCVRTFQGHASRVSGVDAVALSEDGRRALSGQFGDALRLWEVDTGRCLRTFEGNWVGLNGVALSGNGQYGLSASGDLKLWRLGGSGEAFYAPDILCRSQSGESAATTQALFQEAMHRARQAMTNEDTHTALVSVRAARALPGCGRRADAVVEWGRLYAFLPRTSLRDAWVERTFEGHTAEVQSVGMSRNGEILLSGGEDRTLRLWEVATGRCLHLFDDVSDTVKSVCLSRNGRYAASAGWKTLQLWDITARRCLRTFPCDTGVEAVEISRDGLFLVSGHSDGTVRLWEWESGRCLQIYKGHEGANPAVTSVALSGDGRWAASGGWDETVRIWDLAENRCARILGGGASALRKQIESQLSAREAVEGPVLPDLLSDYATMERHREVVFSVAISPGTRYVLSGSGDHTMKLWDFTSGRLVRTFEKQNVIKSVRMSADGKTALSGALDGSLKLWDIETGRCLRTLEGPVGGVNSVCLSEDSRYALSGSDDGTLKLWWLDWELGEQEPEGT